MANEKVNGSSTIATGTPAITTTGNAAATGAPVAAAVDAVKPVATKANDQRSLQEASPESPLIFTSTRTRQSESKTRRSQAQPESFEHGRISHSLGQFRPTLQRQEG